MIMSDSQKIYSCIISGAGPAGMGFLFHAYKTNKLAEICRDGLLIIDKSDTIGQGELGKFINVSANTIGKTFIECITHESFDAIFADIYNASPCYQKILCQPEQAPLLTDASELLEQASERLLAYLMTQFPIYLLSECEVLSVQQRQDKTFHIVYRENRTQTMHDLSTRTVVLNHGGQQRLKDIPKLCSRLGLKISSPDKIIYSSDMLLKLTTQQLINTFKNDLSDTSSRHKRITLIGGSHSAFSLADRLSIELNTLAIDEIVIIHRSPIRLYFKDVNSAARYGYQINPENDICPATQIVNRAGGLRYRAFEVAHSILKTPSEAQTNAQIKTLAPLGNAQALITANSCVNNSIALVHCAGYSPIFPLLLDPWSKPLELQLFEGKLISDEFGQPYDINNHRLVGFFTFGLGSGYIPNDDVGGEPSFKGRLNGIWLFHFTIAKKILSGVLQVLSSTLPSASMKQYLTTVYGESLD